MSRLFDEIKNYPLQDGDTLPPDLKEKIAKIYWLGIHAMPTMRNFSQAALDLHALVHDVIGFESFPPSMEFILNDCVALSLPFDKFFELYERAFEKPPQKKT